MTEHGNLTDGADIELVVVATDQHDTLEACVRALHDSLSGDLLGRLPSWRLSLLDNGSSDATFAVAERLATQLDRVRCFRLPERTDRRALRRMWSASSARTVAYLSLLPDTDVHAVLVPLIVHDAPQLMRFNRLLDRRAALAAIGGVGITALVAACGGSKTKAASTRNPTNTTNTTSPSSSSVLLAPEMTEGPYFLDLDLVRSDVTEDRTGAPFALTLRVVDVAGAAPIKGATVDIWHCDANGLYSGFVAQSTGANGGGTSTADDGTFLRGTQLSDTNGAVTFATIYPGWYRGRTVHIHLKVHVGGSVVHIGQLFFDDGFTDTVFAATKPYSQRAARDTRNADDSIYSEGGSRSTLPVKADGSGYAASLAVGVKAS